MKAVMDIRKINRGLSVSPQIAPADMAELKMAGFRSIICNRPDGEGNDQPTFSEIEEAARAAGLEAYYMPSSPAR
jgi:sulfide:quinone oxidoreductase